MNVSRRSPIRLTLTLAAAVLVLAIGAVAAFGQGATPSDTPSSGGGVSGSSGWSGVDVGVAVSPPDVAAGYGIAAPSWCCGASGYVPGLTTVGQATMDGQGATARDAAIAAAVSDAIAQANAAADAAGIALGPIVDMQVSAMPSYYPMMGTVSGTSGSSPGSPGGGGTEPAPTDPYFGSVSVTVTWSLG
jgi:hypothetical protein